MRCSETSRELGEPLAGTAPQSLGYVCVEHPGPWAAKAVAGTGDDALVALEERVKAHGLRILLVREPGARAGGGALLCSFAGTWVERVPELDASRLDDSVLAALAAGDPSGLGRLERAPLHLVCTNGRRDACCALHGAKVVRALQERFPGRVFESSHLGGHRFAANLLALPHGLFFGRLDPASALATADALERGLLVGSAHLRGRATHSPVEQAADAHLRARLGLHAVDSPSVEIAPDGEPDGAAASRRDEVRLLGRIDGETVALITVRRGLSEPRPISCDDAPEAVESYAVETFERSP